MSKSRTVSSVSPFLEKAITDENTKMERRDEPTIPLKRVEVIGKLADEADDLYSSIFAAATSKSSR